MVTIRSDEKSFHKTNSIPGKTWNLNSASAALKVGHTVRFSLTEPGFGLNFIFSDILFTSHKHGAISSSSRLKIGGGREPNEAMKEHGVQIMLGLAALHLSLSAYAAIQILFLVTYIVSFLKKNFLSQGKDDNFRKQLFHCLLYVYLQNSTR